MGDIDFTKYHDLVVRKLLEKREKRELHVVSRDCGINQARLSEFISGKRSVNALYLMKFVQGGLVRVAELKALLTGAEAEGEKDLIAFLQVYEDPTYRATLRKLVEQGKVDMFFKMASNLVEGD